MVKCLAERDQASPEKLLEKMYYVYILKSLKNGDVYVGYSDDLKRRFDQHNSGSVRSTQFNRPWDLPYYEAYKDKHDATKRERQLKNHAAKNDLKKQLEYSLGKI